MQQLSYLFNIYQISINKPSLEANLDQGNNSDQISSKGITIGNIVFVTAEELQLSLKQFSSKTEV